jgi:NTE family protein
MEKCTAFVLGGGGSRGALQVGAVRALVEAGIRPDLLVGTSIGAVNATGLALWGIDSNGIDQLERAWEGVSRANMLDPRVSQLIFRIMVGRPSSRACEKAENYFVSLGVTRGLTFYMLPYARLALVSADLETGQPVIYGQNPGDPVLEGLLASISIPPWFVPLMKDGQMIVDGGALTTLPIEPAVRMGATEIIALDLDDEALIPKANLTLTQYFEQYFYAASRRHIRLEMEIARMQGIPVRLIDFRGLAKKPIWDFSDYKALIEAGYQKTQREICEWKRETQANPTLVRSERERLPV